MKICFISFEYASSLLGGAGVYAKNISEELAKLGHEVHVLTTSTEYKLTTYVEKGVWIYRIPTVKKPFLEFPSFSLNLKRYYKQIAEEAGSIDILHENGIAGFALNEKLVRVPRIITMHHLIRKTQKQISSLKAQVTFTGLRGESNLLSLSLEKSVVSRASKIIAVSNATRHDLINLYGYPGEKIEVIYNGIDIQEYAFPQQIIEETRRRFGIASKEYLILYAARRIDESRKDVKTLLKALLRVIVRYPVKCVILGAGNPRFFSRMLLRLGIEDHVIFPGFVNGTTKRSLFSSCDIYVHPPALEGFGMAILEAMAAGRPIVATKVGGIPELLTDQQNRFLVRKGDFLELSEMLLYLLEHRTESQLLGRINREKAKELFSWEKTARKTAQLYSSLLGLN